MQKIVMFGNTEFASANYYYLKYDAPFEVVAFTVDKEYIQEDELFGLPVVDFEEIERLFPPDEYKMCVPLSFIEVNKIRAKKYQQAKVKGYQFINYVSSKAIIYPNLVIGQNCFIYENVVIKPFVEIGSDVIIEAGSVIGHHTVIGDHCFLAPNTTVLGKAVVEPYCVLGANSTIRDGIRVASECIIGAGAVITWNTKERGVYIAKPAELFPQPSNEVGVMLKS